jgi:hypothetical protein
VDGGCAEREPGEVPTMINVKEAVKAAHAFARDMYADAELERLQLEEVELSDDERTWHVTLGWTDPAVTGTALPGLLTGPGLPRIYKTFEVDADTGRVRSMKIRDVHV